LLSVIIGFKYAGVQETSCFCSQTYGKHGETSKFDCNLCEDGSYMRCGAQGKNSVYRTNFLGKSSIEETDIFCTPIKKLFSPETAENFQMTS